MFGKPLVLQRPRRAAIVRAEHAAAKAGDVEAPFHFRRKQCGLSSTPESDSFRLRARWLDGESKLANEIAFEDKAR